ncbi:MAG TPA: hypothetical protein VLJ59_16560 [Mycobacteriales bacterium]|nr:hypothetical protein [Mycobacteriales bacterium]
MAASHRSRTLFTVAGLAVVTAALTAFLALREPGSLPNIAQLQIHGTLLNFGTALDQENQTAMLALMCPEEAAGITEDDDYDPDTPPLPTPVLRSRTITDIHIAGDAAFAQVSVDGAASQTVYLRRDQGHWLICTAAATQLNPSPEHH